MASLMENLIDVLDRESTEYEALLQLSQRKTPIIAGGDLAELQKITDEEQELVSRIHNLDKQRAGVTADIADVLNRDVNDLKLPNLITMLSARPAEQQALADSLKLLNEAAPNDQVVKLKALETMEKVADGKATKIIIPSEIQNVAGLVKSVSEIAKDTVE